jgi:hypothetical protein
MGKMQGSDEWCEYDLRKKQRDKIGKMYRKI